MTKRMNRLEMDLRERLARLEGVLGGIREQIYGRLQPEMSSPRPGAGTP